MGGGTAWQALAVACGAAIGALLRWQAGVRLQPWHGLPLGTLTVNLVGGLLIGVALSWFRLHPDQTLLRLLLVVGFLGGLTTFSAFSGESLTYLMNGQFGWALGHTLAHVVGALACAALGFQLGRLMLGSQT